MHSLSSSWSVIKLRTVDRFEDVESLEALILKREGDAVTRLGDIAKVQQSYAELTSRPYSSDGQPVLSVQVRRKPGENLRTASMSVRDAVHQAVESRLRPIAMTTLTTLCGLSPLVFLPGEGTELYRGVGAIVLFGLLGTAIVTVTFLPALTVAVLSWKNPKRSA